MNNKELFQEKNIRLGNNNLDLDSILETINSLPEASIGSLDITENGVYDVSTYETANVNVPTGGGEELVRSILSRTITSFTDNEITNIGNYAFHSCSNLVDVTVNNVTTMGTYVFYGCTKLESFTAPLVNAISVFVFYNTGLKSLTLPNATSIGMHAVRACKSITTVDLGACKSLAVTAFEGDTLLTTVIIRTPSVCTMANVNVFQNTPIESGTGYIYVPDDLKTQYQEASNWSNYASQIKGLSELPA